jgi:WD40 repeat protein
MFVGEQRQLTVRLFDISHKRVDRPIFFESSDSTVATIDAAGLVSAARSGDVSITAASEGKLALLKMKVVDPAACGSSPRGNWSAEIDVLALVDDDPLPVESPWGIGAWDYDADAGTWQLVDWTIRLSTDGTFTQTATHRAASGGTISGTAEGRYERTSDSVWFTASSGACWSAAITEKTLTIHSGGPRFTFIRYPAPPTDGAIELTVSTSGPDQDADGYLLSVSGPSRYQFERLAVSGTQTITGTEPGDVTLQLYGLASNCTLTGENPRKLNVKAGVTATVGFVVNCVASGSLRVKTTTTGADPDVDGYFMVDRDRFRIGSDHSHSFTSGLDIALPPNGTTTASALIPGSYRIAIQNVAPNCHTPIAATEPIIIIAGVETSLTLEFTCATSSQIAFVRGAGREEWEPANIANTDIYVISSNGTGAIRLTSERGADINPAWSPDGRKIAFASDRAGNREIYVMNADGTEPVRLTNSNAPDYSPAFSPDGQRIAFVSERDGNAEIYVMDVDGRNASRLTIDSRPDIDPAFSPDGRQIAFSRNGVGIYVMNADGSAETRLTNTGSDAQPAWSPDGKAIALLREGKAIWLMNADGSQTRQFLDWNYSRANPDWSPDGRSIAFDDRDCWDYGPCPRGIVIATMEGQYSIVIDDASEPAWNPR